MMNYEDFVHSVFKEMFLYQMIEDVSKLLSDGQKKIYYGKNIVTPDKLGNIRVGKFLVEVSYGLFIKTWIIGLTVFQVDGKNYDEEELDKSVNSAEEMKKYLEYLETL